MKRTGSVIAGTLLLATVAAVVSAAALEYAGWPGLAPRLAARGGYGLRMDPASRCCRHRRPACRPCGCAWC